MPKSDSSTGLTVGGEDGKSVGPFSSASRNKNSHLDALRAALSSSTTSHQPAGTTADNSTGSSSSRGGQFTTAEAFVEKQLKHGYTLKELRAAAAEVKNQARAELYEHVSGQYEAFVRISSGLSGLDSDCRQLADPLLKIRAAHADLAGTLQTHREKVQHRVDQKIRILRRKQYVQAAVGLHSTIARLESLVTAGDAVSDQEDSTDDDIEEWASSDMESASSDEDSVSDATSVSSFGSGDECGSDSETRGGTPNNNAMPIERQSQHHRRRVQRRRRRRQRRLIDQSVVLERAALLYVEAKDTLQTRIQGHGEHFEAFSAWLEKIHTQQMEKLRSFLVARLQKAACAKPEELNEPLDGSATASAAASTEIATASGSRQVSCVAQRHRRRQQALVRCLRAFAVLGLAGEVEAAVTQQLLKAFLSRNFTKGRMDFGGARGACSGLPGLLDAYIVHCKSACHDVLCACAAVDAWEFSPETTVEAGPRRPSASAQGFSLVATMTAATAAVTEPAPSFDILGNCVLAALLDVLDKKLSFVFSPGIPQVFHRNYTAIVEHFLPLFGEAFLGSATVSARSAGVPVTASPHIVSVRRKALLWSKLQKHAAFRALAEGRWKLSVYFSIIQSQVQREAEACLAAQGLTGLSLPAFSAGGVSSSSIAPSANAAVGEVSELEAASTTKPTLEATGLVWSLVCRCLNPAALFPQVLSASLELAYLLVRRYCAWCKEKLTRGGASGSSSGTSGGSGSQMAVLVIGSDLHLLKARVICQMPKLFDTLVEWAVPIAESDRDNTERKADVKTAGNASQAEAASPDADDRKEALRDSFTTVTSALEAELEATLLEAWTCMGHIVASTCAKSLSAVRSIAPKLRPRDIPTPAKSSHYVKSVFQSLQAFMMRWEPVVPVHLKGDFVATALRQTVAAFVAATTAVLQSLPGYTSSLGVSSVSAAEQKEASTAEQVTPTGEQGAYTVKVMTQVLLDSRDFVHQAVRFERFLTPSVINGESVSSNVAVMEDVIGPLHVLRKVLEARLHSE